MRPGKKISWKKRAEKVPKRLRQFAKGTARPALNRFLVRYSNVGDPVVFDNELFPWTQRFEESYEAIRQEVIGLSALQDRLPAFQDLSPYQQRITAGDRWKTAYLYGFGQRSETVSQLCPVTSRLLEEVPGLESACFSILSPGTHIVAHRGVYKGLINFHLGVIIPKQAEKCRMKIADDTIVWQPGQSVVFDDTNLHEVWNDTGEERVVLFVQFHRDFRAPARQLSKLFLALLRLTPYLRVPMRNGRVLDAELREVALQRGLLEPGS